jgi:hypothetical protein
VTVPVCSTLGPRRSVRHIRRDLGTALGVLSLVDVLPADTWGDTMDVCVFGGPPQNAASEPSDWRCFVSQAGCPKKGVQKCTTHECHPLVGQVRGGKDSGSGPPRTSPAMMCCRNPRKSSRASCLKHETLFFASSPTHHDSGSPIGVQSNRTIATVTNIFVTVEAMRVVFIVQFFSIARAHPGPPRHNLPPPRISAEIQSDVHPSVQLGWIDCLHIWRGTLHTYVGAGSLFLFV